MTQNKNSKMERAILNYTEIKPFLNGTEQRKIYQIGDRIVERGDHPSYVFFIIKGSAMGQRNYEDGNRFNYFELDSTNGSIGLLEILGQKNKYVATITCITDVEIIKVPSEVVYKIIMSDMDLLKKSLYLLADDLYKRSGNDGLYYYYSGIDRVRAILIEYYYSERTYRNEEKIIVDLSYEQIGNQTGISARTVGRSIREMKQNEEVSIKHKKIELTHQGVQLMKNQLSE